jgi:hypothetical protein
VTPARGGRRAPLDHPARGDRPDRRSNRDRGVASLEVIALYPLLVLFGTFALQAGAAVWTVALTDDAARTAARAASLDQDPAAAAAAALPAALDVAGVRSFGEPAHGVSVTVRVPRVSPLPEFTVTRAAVMP